MDRCRGGAIAVALVATLLGCGGGTETGSEPGPSGGEAPPTGGPPSGPGQPPGGPTPGPTPPPVTPPGVATWAPGFHLALRHSVTVDAVTTYRLKLPITRAGQRVRVIFRAGDGELWVERANIGRSFKDTWRPPVCPTAADPMAPCPDGRKNGANYGAIDGALRPLTFGGKAGFTATARARVSSDPVELPVGFREELYVTFEARGAMAASAINLLEQSYSKAGRHAEVQGRFGAWSPRPLAVATVEVEGAPGPVMVAIGDSITEGYVRGVQDLTNSWAYLAGRWAGVSTVNAGVSGDGIAHTLANLEAEVFVLSGVTDCLVLIGTNDISSHSPGAYTARLSELYGRLAPFCRVWGALIPPKDRTGGATSDGGSGDWERMHATRREVNGWIRQRAGLTGVFDFSGPLTDPARPNYFVPHFTEDGIHPTVAGYQVMGREAAKVIKERLPR